MENQDRRMQELGEVIEYMIADPLSWVLNDENDEAQSSYRKPAEGELEKLGLSHDKMFLTKELQSFLRRFR